MHHSRNLLGFYLPEEHNMDKNPNMNKFRELTYITTQRWTGPEDKHDATANNGGGPRRICVAAGWCRSIMIMVVIANWVGYILFGEGDIVD